MTLDPKSFETSLSKLTDNETAMVRLCQIQRMESIGKISGGIAHEFNNILTVIGGHTELLLKKVPAGSALHSSLDCILSSAQRAAQLTNSMLAYSRKQPSSPQVVDLNDLVCEMETLLRSAMGRNAHLDIELRNHELPVFLDASQVEQVVMNLIANARDALPPEGAVVVKTDEVAEAPSPFAEAGEGHERRYAVLSVTDNGCGMSSDLMEQMYDPYFTSKDVGGGEGLGLSVVAGIVKQHNGFVSCESEVGKGTTFRLYFPICDQQVDNYADASGGGVHASCCDLPLAKDTMILLADDELMVRDLTRDLLENSDCMVMSAVDGEEALDTYRQFAGQLSLIILDINMAKKSGVEVLRELEQADCTVPIILTSGYPINAHDFDNVENLTFTILSRPILHKEDLEDFVGKVKEMLDGNK